jgi:2-C-methyl-D-erythritol 2,4-cyclodiphosphate synthase
MIQDIRTGIGFDVHAFEKNRKLIIGGVEIDHPVGLKGHSDADVLLHAICDAMLGAAALGDIGKHFPDTDPAYKNADSIILLSRVNELIQKEGFKAGNIDSMIALEKPKIAAYIPQMREKIASALNIDISRVSVKATTTEKLGFTGREEGAAAFATVLLFKTSDV